MVANALVHKTRNGTFRVAASAALISVMVGACSSVPDAVNPVKWYEKTSDFFSGDSQSAQAQPADGQNQGLAADPNAPPPAQPAQDVAAAQGGLSADQGSQNYASAPIERQGAAQDVLRSDADVAQAPAAAPPPPVAAPSQPVQTVPMATQPPAAPSAAPEPQTAQLPSGAEDLPPRPQLRPPMSFEGAPPPPTLAIRGSGQGAFGADEFETVVITGAGMEATLPQERPAPVGRLSGAPADGPVQIAASGARFPEPGATTTGQSGMPAPAGLTRVATIHFANASSTLDARDRSILGAVVQLQRERGGRVVVVGHASSRTQDMDYIRHQMVNFEMSMQRAAMVGNALKQLGLAGEHLDIEAVSDTQPLFLEVMPSGEAGNRRVEIYLAS